MLEWSDAAITTVTLGVGWLGGRLSARGRGQRKGNANERVIATCGCGHARAFHEKGSGACNHYKGGYCKCRIYDGPVPMVEYYMTELDG